MKYSILFSFALLFLVACGQEEQAQAVIEEPAADEASVATTDDAVDSAVVDEAEDGTEVPLRQGERTAGDRPLLPGCDPVPGDAVAHLPRPALPRIRPALPHLSLVSPP